MDSYPTLSALLCLEYQFSIGEADRAVDEWIKNNFKKSNSEIQRYIQLGLITVEDKKLISSVILTREEAVALAEELKSSQGIEVKDRRYRLKVYKNCFIGSELVSWLVANKDVTEKEAVVLGQNLFEHNLIAHACRDHDFKNDFLFYEFVD